MTYFRTRRDVLGIGASALAAGTLAGCLGIGNSGNTGNNDSANNGTANGGSPMAASSFAVLGDFAAGVAGDAASVNTLVPVGQHGHGWSPSLQIQREALNSDLFIYMAEGFQPWADNIVTNIKNGGTNVTVVEAREGIDLLKFDTVLDQSGDEHGPEEGHEHEHGNESEHGHEEGHEHGTTNHDEHADHNETAGHDHEDERGYDKHKHKDEDEHGHNHEDGSEHGHESGHGHDHGSLNPHFWLDPQRSKRAVENIREGFITVDSDNAETYAENAEAYSQRLTELDRTFASALRNTPKDVVLVAGHSAYQYLGHEYGFEVAALTGISPDDQPTPKDIAHAQEIITEHKIEYILAPVLESDQAATTLAQQTDAKGVLPITAMAGMTQEWREKNWGYIDLMKNINLPSLKRALGAE